MLEDLLFETLDKYNVLYACELPDKIQIKIRNSFRQLNDAEYYSLLNKYYKTNIINGSDLKRKHQSNIIVYKRNLENAIGAIEEISSEDAESLLKEANHELLGENIAYEIGVETLRQQFLFDGAKWVSRRRPQALNQEKVISTEKTTVKLESKDEAALTVNPTVEVKNKDEADSSQVKTSSSDKVESGSVEKVSQFKEDDSSIFHKEVQTEKAVDSIQNLKESTQLEEGVVISKTALPPIKKVNKAPVKELTSQERIDKFLSDLFHANDYKSLSIRDLRLTFDAYSSMFDENEVADAISEFIKKKGLVAKQGEKGNNLFQRLISTDWIVPINTTGKPAAATKSVGVGKSDNAKAGSYTSLETQKLLKYAGAFLLALVLYLLILRPIFDNDYLSREAPVEEPLEQSVQEESNRETASPNSKIAISNENAIPQENWTTEPNTSELSKVNSIEPPVDGQQKIEVPEPGNVSINNSSANSTIKNGKPATTTQLSIADEVPEPEASNVPQIGKSLKKAKKNATSNLTPTVKTYSGNIGLFDVELTLEYSTVNTKCKEQGLMVTGKYFYVSKPLSKKWIGGYTCGNTIVLNETDGVGTIRGTFTGTLDGSGNIKGKYQTDNGQKIDFYLK